MNPSRLYRTASILLVLYAIGHTVGFLQVDPRWGADAVVRAMQTVHFDVLGFNRSYWDFFVGFGLFVTVLLLFSAALAWQLGGLNKETVRAMPIVTWGFAMSYLAATILTARYFFIPPLVFSAVITGCLLLAAALVRRA